MQLLIQVILMVHKKYKNVEVVIEDNKLYLECHIKNNTLIKFFDVREAEEKLKVKEMPDGPTKMVDLQGLEEIIKNLEDSN